MELGREAEAQEPEAAARPETSSIISALLIPALIFLATFAAFCPVLRNGFVNWDDDKVIQGLSGWRGFGWEHLRWIFITSFRVGDYSPLSFLSYALDYKLWGLDPTGYHLANLIWHCLNAVLFYFISLRLLARALRERAPLKDKDLRYAGAFSALLFSLHPLRVQSVAWAIERRDVLSGFFYLLTILLYLRARGGEAPGNGGHRLHWALLAYLLSLLSKGMGVSLPLALLVLDVYPLGRIGWSPRAWLQPGKDKVFREKIPFFVLALAFGLLNVAAESANKTVQPLQQFGVSARLATASFGLIFYLRKTLWPVRLFPVYETPSHLSLFLWPFWACALAVLLLTALSAAMRRRWKAAPALWFFYLATLAPVIGIFQFGVTIAADRYSYLACLGWALLAGGGLAAALRLGERRVPRGGILAGAGLVLMALGQATWTQSKVWRDSTALWTRVLEFAPQTEIAHGNLGNVFARKGDLDKAIAEYRRALKIKPTNTAALNDYCLALIAKGAMREALAECGRAVGVDPSLAVSHYNWGFALAHAGNLDPAIDQYREAVKIDPRLIQAYINMGVALSAEGKTREAIAQYRKALALSPLDITSYDELGEPGRARVIFSPDLNVDRAIAYYDLGTAFGLQGKMPEAIAAFREAISLNPSLAEAHGNLGTALATQGRKAEAVKELGRALALNPRMAGARDFLRTLRRK